MTNENQKQSLPKINWKNVGSGYSYDDEFGNHWSMTANQEWISMTTPDGKSYSGWTVQECWDECQSDLNQFN